MHDRIINNGQIHAAIFVDDAVSHALHCPPGNGAIACFKLCGQFIGVFGNLDESEQAGVYQDFIVFQFFPGQTVGVFADFKTEKVRQEPCRTFSVIGILSS